MLAAVTGPALFWRGGVMDRESLSFLTHYNDGRPMVASVFDPVTNDFGYYQSRELSHAIDRGDAIIYAALQDSGVTLFVPASSLLASLAVCVVFAVGLRRTMPGLDRLTGVLLLACLVTSFQFVSTMGIYYRSSKPWLMVVVAALLFHLRAAEARDRDRIGRRRWVTRDGAIAGVLLLIGGLLDRQGFFYAAVAIVILAWLAWRSGRHTDLLVGAVAAMTVLVIYDFVIAPLVIHAVNGYWPDFSYQRLPLTDYTSRWLAGRARDAMVLLLENAGGPFGAMRLALPVAVAGIAGFWTAWRRRLFDRATLGAAAAFLAADVVMFTLMLIRHSPIEWIDQRFWNYPLPFLATVIFAVAAWLDGVLRSSSRGLTRLAQVTLVAAIAGNVLGLDRDRAMMMTGEWFGDVLDQSDRLKASLGSGVADPGLRDEYLAFFAHERARTDAAGH